MEVSLQIGAARHEHPLGRYFAGQATLPARPAPTWLQEMLEELHTVFDSLQPPNTMLEAVEEDFPRVVVLQGAGGKAFSGGVDIKVGRHGASWRTDVGRWATGICTYGGGVEHLRHGLERKREKLWSAGLLAQADTARRREGDFCFGGWLGHQVAPLVSSLPY